MSVTPSSPSNRAGDDRNLVPVDATSALTFGDQLHIFWSKNGNAVLALCGLILVGVVVKGGWDYFARQKELDVESAYAAATTPDQLKAFVAAHSDHSLAGVAQLRMADDAYAAGKYSDAIAGYDKALSVLKNGPLAARIQLGRAMAKVQSGKTAEGTADLKQLSADDKQLKAIRTEASYQLASIAADAGNSAEVQKISDQLMQMDPSSSWAQRALMLRANLPVEAPTVAAPAAAAKQDDASSSVQIKLPGK